MVPDVYKRQVYMCHDEKKIEETTLRTLTAGRLKPWDEIHDIHTDSVISLGGTELRICQVPGHTPGSIVILETRENYLFTGDAIGSGCGVWMQIPGSTDLKTYYDSPVSYTHLLAHDCHPPAYHGESWQEYQRKYLPPSCSYHLQPC